MIHFKHCTLPIGAALTAWVVAGLALPATAAPQIKSLSQRGLQTGATTVLVIEGDDLLPEPHVVLPVAIASQAVKGGGTANRVEIELALDASVLPGIYPLRLANARGISNTVAVGIDQLPQAAFANQVAELPVALSGTLTGGTILRTTFAGKAGQELVIDVESHRLGSSLEPVLHLVDPRNVQMAWAQRMPSIAGDARIVAKLPLDGPYTVELHDALYRGAEPGFFRLKLGAFRYADLVFPLGAQRGAKAALALAGTNLADPPALEVDLSGAIGSVPVNWPAGQLLSGTRPQVVASDLPNVNEDAAGAGGQAVTAPAAINGRLLNPNADDRYVLSVAPGQTWRCDVLAARAGSQLDGVLAVLKESGEQIAANDDRPTTTDPGLDFKVPDGVNKVVLSIKDLLGRGGPGYVYRLSVRPADAPDFRLTMSADRHQVPRLGTDLLRIRAERSNYDGAIKLALVGLPAGIALSTDEIPAGASVAVISLTAADVTPTEAVIRVTGSGGDPAAPVLRAAQASENAVSKHQPWLRGELAVAVTEPAPLTVAWEAESTAASLPLGASLPCKIKVVRAGGMTGPVRVSLVTSQIIPKKEVPAKPPAAGKVQEDDLDRALRLAAPVTISPEQTDSVAPLIVPPDLPGIPYDLAFQAELLGGDGKAVLASAYTPVRRLAPAPPMLVELAGEAKVEARSGGGEPGKLTGKIRRLGDLPQPITVTLFGLPADYLAPSVVVAADQSDFVLPVAFPFNTPPGELAGVSIGATAQVAANVTLQSPGVPVAVHVVAGDPPPALYGVFEDEGHFVNLLNEGGGKAALDTADRYAGQAALRVTPDQKFRQKLPGLGVKIAENPGPAEYRYLRFAWKKVGGGNILLQLAANGAWGPGRGQNKPGYRYEAGPANNPINAEAIKVDEKLPHGWTVVTRDLFADFGAFQLDGVAFTAGDGQSALFDHIYLARAADDFKNCPTPVPAEQPLAVFEDQAEFVANLNQGGGTAALATDDRFSGAASARVTPDQRFNPALPGLGVKIRENPGPGEFRYLQFAWKKQGGERVCLQLNHDGAWGPAADKPAKFRYDAGTGAGETFGAALRVDAALPSGWTLVTRDLFADFGEFTLSGLALSPADGDFALFDHIYLGRTPRDFDLVQP